ncbi:MAG: biopolymer transporter ExbD [Massilia sp.]
MSTQAAAAAPSMEPMMELNMTPLIDVMLVLIIMLIITIPRQNHAISLDMPTVSTSTVKPAVVNLEVDFDGALSWNGEAVGDRAGLEAKLAALAAAKDPSQLQVRANKLAPYRYVAAVMAAAQRAGVRQIGMVGNEQFL